jgi:uncharacterized protein YqjF (DUF2071 family)
MMHHWWNSLAFLHWPYEPEAVQRLLPPELELDTHGGRAWVGLVPFVLRVRTARSPFLPWVCTFPETNVRTYVRGPDGRPGIWFLSLDAARLAAVVVARLTWRLPYMWARMRIRHTPSRLVYVSRRRWPGPAATSRVVVDVGEPVGAVDDLTNFLTARFLLWSPVPDGVAATRAEHQPWALRRGRAIEVDPGLLTAAGLDAPTGEPLVHVADDLPVRLGSRQVDDLGLVSSSTCAADS